MDANMNTLGSRVKKIRTMRRWNQADLAKASKITQATISRLESGKTKQLKSAALKRLAKALCTSTDYLVGLSNEY